MRGDSSVRLFQALGEPTRLRVAALLAATRQRACVCELSDALRERVYNVSRHLKALDDAGLLRSARAGRWIYYSFSPPAPLGRALTAILSRLDDLDGILAADRARLAARLSLREGGRCVVWKIDQKRVSPTGAKPHSPPASMVRRIVGDNSK